MVGPKFFYERDPQGLGRGRGYYYYRGKGVWSKEDKMKDFHTKTGPMKIGKGVYDHTHDHKDYKLSPSYPTNLPHYNHRRTPRIALRRKQVLRR